MNNPFQTVGYHGPKYFCDRELETSEIISAFESGRHITLHSIRKLGKTGLIHHIFHLLEMRKNDWVMVYIDIYDTTNAAQFVNHLVTKVLTTIELDQNNLLKRITSFFGRYKPSFGFDTISGTPTISLELRTEKDLKMSLDTLFQIVKEQKKTIIIALDEFQQIGNYPEKYLPASIRKYMQSVPNLRFLFSGSQQNLFLELFTSVKQAMYRSTQLYKLSFLEEKVYSNFIKGQFETGGKTIENSIIDEILSWTRRHTFYTQYICNRLYELQSPSLKIEDLDTIKYKVMKENEVIFHSYRNLLTKPQLKLLSAIAREGKVVAPTSHSFISQYSLKAHSTVRQSLQFLENNELIFRIYDEESGKPAYCIYDVFLWRWLEWIWR